jgi:transcription termination factor Rho
MPTKTTASSSSLDDLIGSPPAASETTKPASAAKESTAAKTLTAKKPAKTTKAAPKTATKKAAASDEVPKKVPVTPLKAKSKAEPARPAARSASRPSPRSTSRSPRQPMSSRMNSGRGNNRNGDGNRFRQNRNNHNSRGNRNGNNGNSYGNNNNNGGYQREYVPTGNEVTEDIKGVLDTSRDGHGVVRVAYSQDDRDAYISASQIRRFRLRPGDVVEGPAREPKENERFWGLLQVEKVNGEPVDKVASSNRIKFQSLTPVYPDEQIKLETGDEPVSLRIIDLMAPIGKGQRSLIVSPPKAGKTTLLKDIATGIAKNHPEIHLMGVLVGERPEEVTDIRRHLSDITGGIGEVAASNFDEPADDQCRVAELALERAKRMVENGKDVVILLDSITRLARAYNLSIPTSGRTLSGGFDPAALFPPKRFFGAARNFEVPGSLTIIGTALVDTGSRMDDLVYEEFKGTGNQEVHLDRRLAERRIHPAIDVQRSGTRRDDLLADPVTYQSVMTLHRMLDTLDKDQQTTTMISQLKRAKTNKEFLASIKAG